MRGACLQMRGFSPDRTSLVCGAGKGGGTPMANSTRVPGCTMLALRVRALGSFNAKLGGSASVARRCVLGYWLPVVKRESQTAPQRLGVLARVPFFDSLLPHVITRACLLHPPSCSFLLQHSNQTKEPHETNVHPLHRDDINHQPILPPTLSPTTNTMKYSMALVAAGAALAAAQLPSCAVCKCELATIGIPY